MEAPRLASESPAIPGSGPEEYQKHPDIHGCLNGVHLNGACLDGGRERCGEVLYRRRQFNRSRWQFSMWNSGLSLMSSAFPAMLTSACPSITTSRAS